MTKNKPKLLLISAISPLPQNSGGATRIHYTLQELSKYYQVELVTFSDKSFALQPKKFSLFFTHGIPYWFSPWYNQKLIKHLTNIFKKNNYDLIQVEFSQLLYLTDYLPKNIPKNFIAHDIASISFFRRISDDNPNIIKKILRWLLFIQIYFYEKKYLPLFDTIITVSKNDKETLKTKIKTKKFICIPNGIDKINFLKKSPSKILNLGYIGSFSHTPNLNAVKYFFSEIAPVLESENIPFKFYLAGNNDPKIIKKTFFNPNLINLGQVKETQEFYEKIDCLVTPIFSGSGSRIKILEALSFGIPIISSPIGAEGLEIKSSYIQIANTPLEYVACLKNLQNNLNSKNLKTQLEPLLWKNIFKNYIKSV
ncbi:MAG: glycosyltransferase family 4 protein [Candidatus Shapirobacteria bacterium]